MSDYFQYRNLLKATRSIEVRLKQPKKVNNSLQVIFKLNSMNNSNQTANKYDAVNNVHIGNNNKNNRTQRVSFTIRRKRVPQEDDTKDINEVYNEMAAIEVTLRNRIFMLSDDIFQAAPSSRDVYNELYRAASLYTKAEFTRIDTFHSNFFLFKIDTINRTLKWRRMATFATSATRSLDKSEEWATTVNIDTPGELELKLWGATRSIEDTDDAEAVYSTHMAQLAIVLLSAACMMCAALVIGAAILKRAANRYTPRRPRAVPILAAADFQFPADERRRVGEGMETMISLLQQLHEFAGPEPERPDLLKRPEPLGPSAPSSTCSVTRLAPDNRTRYKV